MKKHEVTLKGKTYILTDNGWVDSTTWIKPPMTVINALNVAVSGDIEKDLELDNSFHSLMRKAMSARDNGQLTLSEKFARKAITITPDSIPAHVVLCSILRRLNKPREALIITDKYQHSSDSVILTTRAAAFCDIGQHGEALSTIRRALAIKSSDEAFSVYRRIKSEMDRAG